MRRLYKRAKDDLDINKEFNIVFKGNTSIILKWWGNKEFTSFDFKDKLNIPNECSLKELYAILSSDIKMIHEDEIIKSFNDLIDYFHYNWCNDIKEEYKQEYFKDIQKANEVCIFTCEKTSEKVFYALLEQDNEIEITLVNNLTGVSFKLNILIDYESNDIIIRRVGPRTIYMNDSKIFYVPYQIDILFRKKNEQRKEEENRAKNLEDNMKGINNMDIDINQNNDPTKKINRILKRMYKDARKMK